MREDVAASWSHLSGGHSVGMEEWEVGEGLLCEDHQKSIKKLKKKKVSCGSQRRRRSEVLWVGRPRLVSPILPLPGAGDRLCVCGRPDYRVCLPGGC